MNQKPIQDIPITNEDTAPNKLELDNLGPGCYVQVKDADNCFWVEITEVKGEVFSGILHCELGGSVCTPSKENVSSSVFHKNQIVNLGCDNYCWC